MKFNLDEYSCKDAKTLGTVFSCNYKIMQNIGTNNESPTAQNKLTSVVTSVRGVVLKIWSLWLCS